MFAFLRSPRQAESPIQSSAHSALSALLAVPRRPGFYVLLVFLLGGLVTALAVKRSFELENRLAQVALDKHLTTLIDAVTQRAARSRHVSGITAGVVGMMGVPTEDQWAALTDTLAIKEARAVVAMGYATLYSVEGVYHRATVERLYRSATLATTQAALGGDLMHDAKLVATINRAVERGVTQWSEPVLSEAGFYLMQVTPVYLAGLTPDDVDSRRLLVKGVIFTEMHLAEFGRAMAPLIGEHAYLAIYDGEHAGVREQLLVEVGQPNTMRERKEAQVSFGERTWSVVVGMDGGWVNSIDRSRSTMSLLVGSLLTGFICLIVHYLSMMRRRVEQRANEITQELKVSEERHRQLADMSSDWFWEQDANYRFTYMSDGIRAYGGDPASFIGKTRWEMGVSWTQAQIDEQLALLDKHQPIRRFEYQTLGVDGQTRIYLISADPIFDAAGKFAGYRGVGRDVSEPRRIAKALRDSRDNLASEVAAQTADLRAAMEAAEFANKSRSEFVANMSHELRTPLHAIMSFAKLGEGKALSAPPEKLRGYFEKIHTAGDRLLKLVNDLLDLSKLEAGKMLIHAAPRNLLALVHEVADELQPLLTKQGLRLVLPEAGSAAGTDGIYTAEVDAQRMVQVLRNLLSNAIKFSHPHGTITVTLARGDILDASGSAVPALVLSVFDEGIGIPENELDIVFDKFVQSSKTKTGAGGTGLGLSITREIVDAHFGQIRAYNRPGGGAAFEVKLPLTYQPNQPIDAGL